MLYMVVVRWKQHTVAVKVWFCLVERHEVKPSDWHYGSHRCLIIHHFNIGIINKPRKMGSCVGVQALWWPLPSAVGGGLKKYQSSGWFLMAGAVQWVSHSAVSFTQCC